MSRPWYYPTALTRDDMPVRLLVNGVERTGWRTAGRRGPVWIVAGPNRETERLPRWVSVLWQPLDLAAWRDPLPAVTATVVGPHVAAPKPPPAPVADERPADDSQIAADGYALAPHIPAAECETRLLRALLTDRALPDRERAALRVRANWPPYMHEPGDYPPAVSLRWRPTKQDVDDYLVAMGWYVGLDPHERRIVRWRALGRSFKSIGQDLGGRSDEHARRAYHRALARALLIANAPAPKNKPQRQRMREPA